MNHNAHNPSQAVDLSLIAMVPQDAAKKFEVLKNLRTLGDSDADFEFVEHLQKNGLLQPIGLARKPRGLKLPKGKEYIVVWGNRRFQALTVWLEKKIRAQIQKKIILEKEKCADLAKKFDARPFNRELKNKLERMPTHVSAVIIDTDDPILISAKNFQENAVRCDPHWTDTASRALLLSDEAKKRAGKEGYPKTYGNGQWVGEVLGLSKSMSNNYLRCARLLSPKLWDLARRDQGIVTTQMAIKLSAIGKDARTESDRHDQQWKEFERMTGTVEPEDPKESKKDLVSRPGLDELEAKLADVLAGGYAAKRPNKLPSGSAEFKDGFGDGWAVGYQEALITALKYATGRRKSFPKAGFKK